MKDQQELFTQDLLESAQQKLDDQPVPTEGRTIPASAEVRLIPWATAIAIAHMVKTMKRGNPRLAGKSGRALRRALGDYRSAQQVARDEYRARIEAEQKAQS